MAKKRNPKDDLRKIEKGAVRSEMKEQGALDGRYREKVVEDKTKYKRKKKHRKDEGQED